MMHTHMHRQIGEEKLFSLEAVKEMSIEREKYERKDPWKCQDINYVHNKRSINHALYLSLTKQKESGSLYTYISKYLEYYCEFDCSSTEVHCLYIQCIYVCAILKVYIQDFGYSLIYNYTYRCSLINWNTCTFINYM